MSNLKRQTIWINYNMQKDFEIQFKYIIQSAKNFGKIEKIEKIILKDFGHIPKSLKEEIENQKTKIQSIIF